MKVIYIDNKIQNEETENPQLIDGELYYWEVYPIRLRYDTLQEEISHMRKLGKTKYLLIHEVRGVDKYFCDQGCKLGEGCKEYYVEGNHGLMLDGFKIKN